MSGRVVLYGTLTRGFPNHEAGGDPSEASTRFRVRAPLQTPTSAPMAAFPLDPRYAPPGLR